jgi:hypothetical protein
MKTMKNLSQDSRSPGRGLKPGPPGYGAGVLTACPRRWVTPFVIIMCDNKAL